jgi:hypothetical protein
MSCSTSWFIIANTGSEECLNVELKLLRNAPSVLVAPTALSCCCCQRPTGAAASVFPTTPLSCCCRTPLRHGLLGLGSALGACHRSPAPMVRWSCLPAGWRLSVHWEWRRLQSVSGELCRSNSLAPAHLLSVLLVCTLILLDSFSLEGWLISSYCTLVSI